MSDLSSHIAYVRTEDAPRLPAPPNTVGVQGWLRANLFSSATNSILTIAFGAFIVWLLFDIMIWALVDAVWTGADREACIGAEVGACWPFVADKFAQWVYGFYPIDQRWRVNIVYVVMLAALVPMLIPSVPYKKWNALFLLTAFPLLSLILLTGGNFDLSIWAYVVIPGLVVAIAAVALWLQVKATGTVLTASLMTWGGALLGVLAVLVLLDVDFGLQTVETSQWGGLLVTLVVATTGITASLPLGILLALGRRSDMPVVKLFSVAFIELWRGVPLITVLFMSSVMLPLFLPVGTNFDKLLRALVGVALFSAAYMAEVVRSGLQAIPKGQYEGAHALGLSYWQTMRMIILPQALKIAIPNIVGNFISLFKDTTLVSIIGLFDLLGIVRAGLKDANWAAPATTPTGYFTLALMFWIFCFGMSRYAMYTERRLHTGHKR
jgi:general L-amino acid transport system permease protein